ncbi:MAG: hypothetical protein PVH89_01355 [Gammaproteobacteria bacterium]|jgi:hypothetical protein
MSEEKAPSEPTLVEKWIKDQQEWQKMATEYFDSMVKNDEFLVHLGNAMRGSLLAGKPYPGTEPSEEEDEAAAADDRIDLLLHALHLLQGDVADLKVAVEDLTRKLAEAKPVTTPAPASVGAAVPHETDSAPPPEEAQSYQAPADFNRGEG